MTALVIIITGQYKNVGLEGAQLTSEAFGTAFSWFPLVLAGAVFLFAFSTMISWSYYGLKAWTYLFGESTISENVYKILFLIFVIIGASTSMNSVITFSDIMILAMAIPNVIGLLIMSGEVSEDLNDYMHRVKSGLIKQFK